MPPRSMIASAGPAELAQEVRNDSLGLRVVSGDEDVVWARNACRIDHHGYVNGVERLNHARFGEGALDLLAELLGGQDSQ